jgi:tagatose-1,6-bisphosphate aldolase non-catalytic subunit AgaZ/GatZ
VVVQPGVEFGNENVVVLRPAQAAASEPRPRALPQFVFEAAFDRLPARDALSRLWFMMVSPF